MGWHWTVVDHHLTEHVQRKLRSVMELGNIGVHQGMNKGSLHSYDTRSYMTPPLPFCMVVFLLLMKRMKSIKVQTFGELRMRGTELLVYVYSWSPASSSQRVWHGLAAVVDSMRESIHALCCDFLYLQDTQSKRTGSRLISAFAFSAAPDKIADYALAVQWWKCSSFATVHFQRKPFEILTFLAR